MMTCDDKGEEETHFYDIICEYPLVFFLLKIVLFTNDISQVHMLQELNTQIKHCYLMLKNVENRKWM